MDFYGFGASPIDRALTLQDYCDGVIEVLEYLGVKQICVVGHSFGGRVAMELASKTDKVRSMVLVDSAGLKPRRTLKKTMRKLKYKIYKALGKSTEKCGSKDYRELSHLMKKTFVNVVNYHQDGLLHTIHCPVLIVWGKTDKETPKYMAKKLNRGLARSTLIWLKGGHWCYIESLGDFVKRTMNWLENND